MLSPMIHRPSEVSEFYCRFTDSIQYTLVSVVVDSAVYLMLNGASALIRLSVPRIVEIKYI